MSKFAAALNARQSTSEQVQEAPVQQPIRTLVAAPARRVGRPAGKRSNPENTQVTGYVPYQLYLDVQDKLLARKRHNRRAKTDFSDLLREWMESWLSEQP